MRTDEVAFMVGESRIAGTLHLPDGEGPHPAVVIVHGSGAVDRFGIDGTLRPVITHFAASGYATLSYDKPGVGESSGRWMDQTFDDRAAETLLAVRFLAGRPDVDACHIGLWAISQGGWTAPLTATLAPGEIDFTILVSASAMTPCEQSMHQLNTELTRDGFTAHDIGRAVEVMERRTAGMRAGRAGADILATEPLWLAGEPWYPYCETDEEELDYVRPIWHFDVSPLMRRLSCPVLAIWGADDVHMPAQRCAATFAADLAAARHPDFRLQVYPHADHRLRVSRTCALAPGYLDDMTHWLSCRSGTADAAARPPSPAGD
ncbi:alpha/beta hydrolase family protein [Sphaerisporangium aureirubrum]|uniref:Alpha/beta hydrolase family protein n=1 Tax=Sphaerisporangium aureirubrum TaxID=1544736 RepID=A0ABW1NBZ0_9ACTN